MSRIALLLGLAAGLSAAVYQAPSREPTDVETAILVAMNRFRADPAAEADRILALKGKMWTPKNVDWKMFAAEVKALKPAPPLVFDLDALDSARKHSYYMIHNGLGHVEAEGKEGFTGKSFGNRMKAAGFKGGPGGENCFAAAGGAEHSNAAFIIDFGPGGPGGMQKGRGHRRNMINPGFNVIGCSAVPAGRRYSVTHNFGRKKGRFAGGVVFVDKNRNGAYDAGEGKGGVTIMTADGKAKTVTWRSGAYTLKLPGSGAVKLVAEAAGQRFAAERPAGKGNVEFSWAVPPEADLKRADELIAKVAAITDEEAKTKQRFAALVELHQAAGNLCLDPERQAKVTALLEPVAEQLAGDLAALLAAVDGDDERAAKDVIKDGQNAYRGTLRENLYQDATAYLAAKRATTNVGANQDKFTGSQKTKLLTMLEKTKEQVTSREFLDRFDALIGQATQYIHNERTKASRKGKGGRRR